MFYTIIGDPHIKIDNLDKFSKIVDHAEFLCNDIICLGDVFDNKSIIRGECLNFVINRVKSSKRNWIFLVGNHDFFTKETLENSHSLYALKDFKNVTIIDKPTVIKNMFLLPYYEDIYEFKRLIDNNNNSDVLICHQGFTGFDYGNGIQAKNEASLSWINKYKLVIAGHFHKFQKKYNLIILGTPFSHSFSESNQDKVIAVFNSKDMSFNTIETDLPKHRTIEVNLDVTDTIDINNTDYWRVILTGTEDNVKKFNKDKYPSVKFIEKPNTIVNNILIHEEFSNEVKFKTLSEEKGLDNKTIDLGIEYLKECSTG